MIDGHLLFIHQLNGIYAAIRAKFHLNLFLFRIFVKHFVDFHPNKTYLRNVKEVAALAIMTSSCYYM